MIPSGIPKKKEFGRRLGMLPVPMHLGRGLMYRFTVTNNYFQSILSIKNYIKNIKFFGCVVHITTERGSDLFGTAFESKA